MLHAYSQTYRQYMVPLFKTPTGLLPFNNKFTFHSKKETSDLAGLTRSGARPRWPGSSAEMAKHSQMRHVAALHRSSWRPLMNSVER